MGFFAKLKFVSRLMADPDVDRIFCELKEGRLKLAHNESMEWWQREAAFLYAHSLEGAVKAGMKVGANPKVEAGVIFMGAKMIQIGDDFTCSFGAGFRAVEAPIKIGSKVNVGPMVQVIGANHGMAADKPIGEQPHESIEVVIGDDAWLGAGSIILPGAIIGDGAVIGAGSVVTGEVPAMTVFAGAPARKVRGR